MDSKISIITPVFNAAQEIGTCILSVADQTYNNIEHLIIDGHSTDGSVEVIKSYSLKYPHIRWISEPDQGIYDAMNKGIDLATGDYLYFLGADDVFHDAQVLASIFNNPDIKNFEFIYGNVKLVGPEERIYGGEATLQTLKTKNISHQAIFYNKLIFKKLGKYGSTFKVCEDYLFNIRCFHDQSIKRKYLDLIIADFGSQGISSTTNDGFIRHRLTYFKDLSIMEKIKKLYFFNRPDWFRPSAMVSKWKDRKKFK